MEEDQLLRRLVAIETKIEAVYESSEKTRKYFLWFLIVSVLAVVVPLFGTLLAIPYFLKMLSSSLGGMI